MPHFPSSVWLASNDFFPVFPEAPWWVEGPWYEPLMVSLVAPDWYRSSLEPFDDMFDPFRDLSRAPKSKFRTVLAHILIFPAGRPSQIFMVRHGLCTGVPHIGLHVQVASLWFFPKSDLALFWAASGDFFYMAETHFFKRWLKICVWDLMYFSNLVHRTGE